MKFHITNKIENDNDLYVQVGRKLGLHEIILPKWNDADEAYLDAQLDGALTSVEDHDVVIIQSFFNTHKYEQQVMDKLQVLHCKIIFVIHELNTSDLNLYQKADEIVVKQYSDKLFLEKNDIFKVSLLENESTFDIERVFYDFLEQYSESKYSKDEEIIHVAFGLHDKTGDYSIWVGVTMQTILKHTDASVCFHILHDDTLNEENKNRLLEVCKDTNSYIEFHKIDINVFNQIAEQVQGYTIGSVFRILIPDILSNLDKVLYLDADLFVNIDILELWKIDLDHYCLAAVKDIDILNQSIIALPVTKGELRYDEYFNSGVLLMNLKEIRIHGNMKDEIVNYLISHPESNLPDQDALNVVYKGKVKFIDPKFNRFIRTIRQNNELPLQECIYHYVGTKCFLSHLNEVDLYYYKEIFESPWGVKYSEERIKQSLYRTKDRIETYEIILNQMINKNVVRIFVGNDYVSKNVYQIIPKREQDIQLKNLDEIESTLNSLKEKNVKCIIFVSINVPNCIQSLENIGLQNQKDFFVMQRFLSNLIGGFI